MKIVEIATTKTPAWNQKKPPIPPRLVLRKVATWSADDKANHVIDIASKKTTGILSIGEEYPRVAE